jgi:hydrogenase-1 operon protein HyaF
MSVHDVPVLDPMIRALLCEIETKLASLLARGETTRIDLRRLPLPPGGLGTIRDLLGKGEVDATLRGVGSCSFVETAISGVWWGTQHNTAGDTVGEFIEIAPVPDLLKADHSEMQAAVVTLRRRLAGSTD